MNDDVIKVKQDNINRIMKCNLYGTTRKLRFSLRQSSKYELVLLIHSYMPLRNKSVQTSGSCMGPIESENHYLLLHHYM